MSKTKQELIADVAETAGLTRKDASAAIDAVFASITGDLTTSGEATLPGLGKLFTKAREARIGRNPRTGEQVEIPATIAVKFSAAKALKDAVN